MHVSIFLQPLLTDTFTHIHIYYCQTYLTISRGEAVIVNGLFDFLAQKDLPITSSPSKMPTTRVFPLLIRFSLVTISGLVVTVIPNFRHGQTTRLFFPFYFWVNG